MARGKAVVIGGGVLGVASAMELAQDGWRVELLERGSMASAASGGNLGQISLIDRCEDWHMELTQESLQIYHERMKHRDFEFFQNGGSVLIEDEDELQKALLLQRTLAVYGVKSEIYEGNDCLPFVPGLDIGRVRGIFHCPSEGAINPLKTVTSFWDDAVAAGASLWEHREVIGLQMEGNRIIAALTADGPVEGDCFVNCAGSWAGEIGRMADMEIPLSWRRGTAMVTTPMKPVVIGQLCDHQTFGGIAASLGGDGDLLISAALSQTKNGNLLIAQATEYTDRNSKDISLVGVCRVASALLERFPSCRDVEILRMWAAVTPFSDDGNPFFGFGRSVENLLTAAGFKGAFSTAPAVARRVKDTLNGNSSWMRDSFRPDRKPERRAMQ